MAVNIQLRRGTTAEWTLSNPTLTEGEVGVETDTKKLKVGDGLTTWSSLPYINLTPAAAASIYATIANPTFTGTVSLDTGASLVFEGATANAFETTVAVTDPTADRTITLPDATGTVVLADGSGNVTVSGNLTVSGTTTTINSTTINATTGIVFEGLTANDFETTLAVEDPTADRTITFPDATGTVALVETVNTSLSSYVESASIGEAAGVAGLDSSKNLVVPGSSVIIEGATDNSFETTLTVTDPTADRVLTLPDETGTLATQTWANSTALNHTSATTQVHGIVDTAQLATKEYVDTAEADAITSAGTAADTKISTAISTHSSDTTAVHGITDTAELATKSYADTAVSTHASSTNVHGITDTAQLATKTYADSAVSTHSSDTTEVHGIADTSILVTTTGTQTLTNKTITTPAGLVKSDVGLGNVDNTTDANKPISTATQTALDLKAPLANPTFTGTVTLPNNTISQAMMGDDSVGTNEIGGLAVTTGKIADLAVTTGKIADLAVTEGKIADSAVTSAKIADGTIVNADINASAAIAQSKVADLTTDLAAKLALSGGTMTGTLTLSGAPTSDLHAATKLYVDNVTAGLNFHEAVHAASVSNLTATYSNGASGVGATLTANTNEAFSTLDGESVVLNERVLIKNQTDAKQNGIYTLTTVGSVSAPWVLTRATDADNNPTGEMKNGDFVFVQRGTVNASVGYINNSATNPIVIGTDNISYTEFNAGKTIVAGDGLTEATPGTISVATSGITSAMIADGTIVDADVNASAAIAQSKISGLSTSLSEKAPLASPTFTGTVTLPAEGIVFSDGTQAKEGVPSRTPIIQKTGSYTLSALTERDSLIEMASSSAMTLTIPADSTLDFPIGTSLDVLQTSTGQVTIAGAGGVTVNSTPGLKLRTTWSSATLFKRAANTWVVFGDLTA